MIESHGSQPGIQQLMTQIFFSGVDGDQTRAKRTKYRHSLDGQLQWGVHIVQCLLSL